MKFRLHRGTLNPNPGPHFGKGSDRTVSVYQRSGLPLSNKAYMLAEGIRGAHLMDSMHPL